MAETLRSRVRQGAMRSGLRAGPTTGVRERVKGTRARRDMVLVRRVFGDNFQVYGRAQGPAAVQRRGAMHSGEADARRGIAGSGRGKRRRTMSDQAAPSPAGSRQSPKPNALWGGLGLQRRSKRRERGDGPPQTGLAGAGWHHRKRRGSGNSLRFPAPRPQIPCSSNTNSLLGLSREFGAK
jgi:hypothetical protein